MLALVTDAFGGRSGIAQYNRDFMGAVVDRRGAPVSPITVLPRHAPRSSDSAARHSANAAAARAYRLCPCGAGAVALTRRIDIVFCGHLYMAPLAALIARLKGAKLIIQTHGIEAWPQPSRTSTCSAGRCRSRLSVSRYTRAAVFLAGLPSRLSASSSLPNTVGEAFTPGDGIFAARRHWDLRASGCS